MHEGHYLLISPSVYVVEKILSLGFAESTLYIRERRHQDREGSHRLL